jgi:hypothetical protein
VYLAFGFFGLSQKGAEIKPYDPVTILKAKLLKHLRGISSDRRLAILLKWNRRIGGAS